MIDLAIFLGGISQKNYYVTILRRFVASNVSITLVSLLLRGSQHGKLPMFLLRRHFYEKEEGRIFCRKQIQGKGF